MSTQGQPQKPNYVTILLFFAIAYFGVNLFMGGKEAPGPTRTPVQVYTAMQATHKKNPTDTDALQKHFAELQGLDHPKGDKVWEDNLLKGWKLYAEALEAKGFEGPADERNHDLEQAEIQYVNFRDSYPDRYKELVGDEKIPQIHRILDSRYPQEPRYYIGLGYQFVKGLVNLTGNIHWFSYTFAIVLLAILVRVVTYPINQRQFRFMRQMKALAPITEEIKKRYSGQEAVLKQQELFKKYNINYGAACLGMAAPLPFFMWMYSVIRAFRYQFEHGTFLWIQPSVADSVNSWFVNTFHVSKTFQLVAPNLGHQDNLLLLIYGVTMYIQQRMTVMDPGQANTNKNQSLIMSLVLLVMMFFWKLPSAFVVYWISFNVLYTVQQLWVNREPTQVFEFELPDIALATNGAGGTGAPKLHKPSAKKRRR